MEKIKGRQDMYLEERTEFFHKLQRLKSEKVEKFKQTSH